jgi:hypothetical protein
LALVGKLSPEDFGEAGDGQEEEDEQEQPEFHRTPRFLSRLVVGKGGVGDLGHL